MAFNSIFNNTINKIFVMKTVKINNHELKLYDSIDEMPIVNFQKYNKYIIVDSGLGSDIDSVDEHLVNLAKLIKSDKDKAQQELQNLRQTMHLIVSGISPNYLAFAALIHSIDGKVVEDLSDENLKSIIEKLQKAKHSMIVSILMWVKKKLATELEMYFPNSFNDVKDKEVYDKIKQRTILQLESIAKGIDNADKIEEIDAFLFSLHKPKSFNGKTSIEIKYDKQFETACMIISQKSNMNAKKMTVLEFYSTLNNLSKQAEAEAKAYKKVRR